MAAESAILVAIGTSMASALLKVVLEKCVDAVSKTSTAAGLKSAVLGSLKTQLLDLQRELSKLHALLCSAERLDPVQQSRNDLVLLWLGPVRDAANFADNVLEDISYDQMRRQVEKGNRVAKYLCAGSHDTSSLLFRVKIGSRLSKFMSMTVKIYKEAAEIGLRPVELVANPASYQPPAALSTDLREVRENVDTSMVVGRQLDEDYIVNELLYDGQELEVIALVGMSGVGKTTLARKIYDSEIVREHYEKQTWIFVSEDFSLIRLLDEMLQSLTGANHNLSNIDAMERKLQKCLGKERYLLVLDDVWNTDQQIWDSIRSSLLRITTFCTGSRVLVTTQNQEVASVMGASLTHQVRALLAPDARALFEAKAFANKSQQRVSDLRSIGDKILRKCGGLPLAINTLASLLGSMNDISQWESVERSQVWDLPVGQTKIMPWLLISFNHLPSAVVKRCFAYCSIIIPKGGAVGEIVLVSSWIAQGFIQQSETGYDGMVFMAHTYIRSMLANGLLQLINSNGYRFFMHDLIHDLALYVSKNTCLIIKDPNDMYKASSGVEHVRIYGTNAWTPQLSFPEGNAQSTLCTLSCFGAATIAINEVVQATLLRSLTLIGCGLTEIPCSLGRLNHLRILDLSDNSFEYLPGSIGRLYNLHILALARCHRLIELPQAITKLLNLRIISTTKAVHIPKGMGQLTCLTQLPIVKLKAGDGCKVKELSSLLLVRGRVTIKELENISCKEDAIEAGLKMKAEITRLELIWTSEGQEGNMICSNYEMVMEGLQPHSNLQVLWVENFRGTRFSAWLSNALDCSNLRELALVGCTRCEQLPTLGLLPFLKVLTVDGMESVEVMGRDFFYTWSSHHDTSESNFFPQLASFVLSNMPKLKDWFDPTGSCASAFPCLEGLHIVNCPLLVNVPSCFHSLKQLTTRGVHSGQPLLMILSNSYNLTSLIVEYVHQLTCLSEPLLKCTCLQELRIKECQELVELPPTLQSLSYLQILDVAGCNNLKSLPDIKGLLSLRHLDVVHCDNITDIPSALESCVSIERLGLLACKFNLIPDLSSLSRLRLLGLSSFSEQLSVPPWLNQLSDLTELFIGGFNKELDHFCGINLLPKSLRTLRLIGWPNLKSLPNELGSLTQLAQLFLSNFEGVEALPEWLCNLSSLQVLDIRRCRNMNQLPSSVTMRSLTQLRELRIMECPILEQRCKKVGGDQWHKISHLTFIEISGVKVT